LRIKRIKIIREAYEARSVAAIPFPIIMRKMTKLKPKEGLMHIVVPFAYGLTFNYATHLVKIVIR
jgi:hypothetical protein